jgi:hypothetical protein
VAHAMVPGRRPRRRAPTEGDGNGSSATMTLVDTRGRQGGVGGGVFRRGVVVTDRAVRCLVRWTHGGGMFFLFLIYIFSSFFCFFLFFYFFTFIFYFLFYFFALLFLFISSFINCLFNTE